MATSYRTIFVILCNHNVISEIGIITFLKHKVTLAILKLLSKEKQVMLLIFKSILQILRKKQL